jgi:hypothetical protein
MCLDYYPEKYYILLQSEESGVKQLLGPHLLTAVGYRSRSYFTTNGQSVSMSWYQAPLWDL